MLSIIVCSVSPKKLEDFKANVEKTIGIKEYEIIAIDNRADKNPIAVVYNKGARLAKYPNLLFIHEDVCFHLLPAAVQAYCYLFFWRRTAPLWCVAGCCIPAFRRCPFRRSRPRVADGSMALFPQNINLSIPTGHWSPKRSRPAAMQTGCRLCRRRSGQSGRLEPTNRTKELGKPEKDYRAHTAA